MLVCSLSKYLAVPLLCEWLRSEDLLKYDSALCNQACREGFSNLTQAYNETFQRAFIGDQRLLLTVGMVLWMRRRQFSMHLVDSCIVLPTFLSAISSSLSLIHHELNAIRSLDIAVTVSRMDHLSNLLSLCTSLQKISLSSASDEVFNTLGNFCPLLKSCSLRFDVSKSAGSQHSAFGFMCMMCSKLDVLELISISDTVVKCIVVHCRCLKNLIITDYYQDNLALLSMHYHGEIKIITPLSWDPKKHRGLVLTQRSKLKHLEVDIAWWDTFEIKQHCPNITELHLSCMDRDHTNLCEILESVPNLRVFDLIGNLLLLNDVAILTMAKCCKDLRKMTLGSIRHASVSAWRTLFTELSHLAHLTVRNITSTNDTSQVLSCLNQHPALSLLSIWPSHLLKDDEVSSFGPLLYNVSSLHLSNCNSLTHDGLISLVHSCSMLTELTAHGSQFIRDQGIIELMKCHGSSLRILKLRLCSRITDTCLSALVEHGSRLRVLGLSTCERISLEGLENVVKCMRRLRELTTSFHAEGLRQYASEDLSICCKR